MQQIQIARGSLGIRLNNTDNPLLKGELFLDYKDEREELYDLYVGIGDGKAKKIGGNAGLTFEGSITTLPTEPVVNGVYYVGANIDLDGKDYEVPLYELKKGDLVVYVGDEAYSITKDDSDSLVSKGWIKVGGGGSTAYDVEFDNKNTNLTATNVQEALVEIDRNKLAYGGDLTLEEDKDEYTEAEIFEKVKAGYYYYVPKTITIGTGDDAVTYKKGDFISVTSDVTSNANELTLDDVTLTKIPGGVHGAEDLEATMGERNDTYKGATDKAWESADANVKTVQEALDVLAESKADLNSNGKVLLTQLPDTLVGGMEFLGTAKVDGEKPTWTELEAKIKELKESIVGSVHGDDYEEGAELTKGDYWIYSGNTIQLTDAEKDTVSSVEGLIESGDWVVYNGTNISGEPNWSVIDNTSAIANIAVAETEDAESKPLAGDITFSGSNRNDTDNYETELVETKLTVVGGGTTPTIVVETPNAALVTDDEAVSDGTIYKAGENKTLEQSGLKEADDTLTIKEKEGIVLTGAEDYEGNKLGNVSVKQNGDQGEDDIDITLPSKSGTLARVEDLNTAFAQGKDFFIPRYAKDEETDELTLIASPISLVRDTEESESLHGILFSKGDDENGSTLNNDVEILFASSAVEGDTTKVVHKLPATSGILLNTNTIIDCGEFTEDGFVAENEGAVSTLYKIEGSTVTNTTADDYKVGKLHEDVGAETTEEIEAYISEN